jgi:hypothetical protein
MTRVPRSAGSTLVLKLNQETVQDFVLLFLPPCGPHLTPLATGSLEPSYLSSPHLEASLATTFRACSSHAPTPVKLQPAPAMLSQESVYTMLSITHHTRKRPSTGPRTTHGPQSPPWWVHWQHTRFGNQREERKEKTLLKETPTSDRKPKERQRARTVEEEQVSDRLGEGNGSTHPRQTMLKKRAQTTNPKLEQHNELPLHICKLLLSQGTLHLNQCNNATWECNKEWKPAHST